MKKAEDLNVEAYDAPVRAAVGRRMREVREQLGESQERFAARMGVKLLTVFKYESGASAPGVDQLARLKASGVDPAYVAFGAPSLDTAMARRQFAAALAWVTREAQISSPQVSQESLIDAAWLVFRQLTKMHATAIPNSADMQQHAISAIEAISQADYVQRR